MPLQTRLTIAALTLGAGAAFFAFDSSAEAAGQPAPSHPLSARQDADAQPNLSGLLYGYGKGKAPIDLGHGDSLRGYASYSLEKKKLYLKWLTQPGSGDQIFRSLQEETLSFWPTDVCGYGPDRIAVAGVDARGSTVIEVWTLRDIPVPAAIYDSSGQVQYPEISVPITSRVVVFDADDAGTRHVKHMSLFLGRTDALLVQFLDSRDIYALYTGAGALQLVATPGSGGEQVLGVPLLVADSRPCFQAMTHPSLGHTYSFSAFHTDETTLILRDANQDGILEAADQWDPTHPGAWIDLAEVTYRAR